MDFSALIAELRNIASSYNGRDIDSNVSTAMYCEMFHKILQKAESEVAAYDDQIVILWMTLSQLCQTYKTLTSCRERNNLYKHIFLLCAKVVLNIKWQQLPDDDQSKENFRKTVEDTHRQLVMAGFDRFGLLLNIMENPWTDPILSKIMSGETDDDEDDSATEEDEETMTDERKKELEEKKKKKTEQREAEFSNYINQADVQILRLRVEMLMQENCEEWALNLCNCCLRQPRYKHDLEFKCMELVLLFKLNNMDKIQEECEEIICHTGISIIEHLEKKESNQSLCVRLIQIFLVQDWIKPDRNCCTKKLLQIWIKYQSMQDKDREKFLDSVWAIAKISSSTEQICQLVTGLVKKCGLNLLQLYTDLCVYAINFDKGCCEKQMLQGNLEEVKKQQAAISTTCLKLADLYCNCSPKVARIAALTAFALNPSIQNFNVVRKTFTDKRKEKMQAVKQDFSEEKEAPQKERKPRQSKYLMKVNPATLHEVERLLNMLRPYYLDPEMGIEKLLPVCQKFMEERGPVEQVPKPSMSKPPPKPKEFVSKQQFKPRRNSEMTYYCDDVISLAKTSTITSPSTPSSSNIRPQLMSTANDVSASTKSQYVKPPLFGHKPRSYRAMSEPETTLNKPTKALASTARSVNQRLVPMANILQHTSLTAPSHSFELQKTKSSNNIAELLKATKSLPQYTPENSPKTLSSFVSPQVPMSSTKTQPHTQQSASMDLTRRHSINLPVSSESQLHSLGNVNCRQEVIGDAGNKSVYHHLYQPMQPKIQQPASLKNVKPPSNTLKVSPASKFLNRSVSYTPYSSIQHAQLEVPTKTFTPLNSQGTSRVKDSRKPSAEELQSIVDWLQLGTEDAVSKANTSSTSQIKSAHSIVSNQQTIQSTPPPAHSIPKNSTVPHSAFPVNTSFSNLQNSQNISHMISPSQNVDMNTLKRKPEALSNALKIHSKSKSAVQQAASQISQRINDLQKAQHHQSITNDAQLLLNLQKKCNRLPKAKQAEDKNVQLTATSTAQINPIQLATTELKTKNLTDKDLSLDEMKRRIAEIVYQQKMLTSNQQDSPPKGKKSAPRGRRRNSNSSSSGRSSSSSSSPAPSKNYVNSQPSVTSSTQTTTQQTASSQQPNISQKTQIEEWFKNRQLIQKQIQKHKHLNDESSKSASQAGRNTPQLILQQQATPVQFVSMAQVENIPQTSKLFLTTTKNPVTTVMSNSMVTAGSSYQNSQGDLVTVTPSGNVGLLRNLSQKYKPTTATVPPVSLESLLEQKLSQNDKNVEQTPFQPNSLSQQHICQSQTSQQDTQQIISNQQKSSQSNPLPVLPSLQTFITSSNTVQTPLFINDQLSSSVGVGLSAYEVQPSLSLNLNMQPAIQPQSLNTNIHPDLMPATATQLQCSTSNVNQTRQSVTSEPQATLLSVLLQKSKDIMSGYPSSSSRGTSITTHSNAISTRTDTYPTTSFFGGIPSSSSLFFADQLQCNLQPTSSNTVSSSNTSSSASNSNFSLSGLLPQTITASSLMSYSSNPSATSMPITSKNSTSASDLASASPRMNTSSSVTGSQCNLDQLSAYHLMYVGKIKTREIPSAENLSTDSSEILPGMSLNANSSNDTLTIKTMVPQSKRVIQVDNAVVQEISKILKPGLSKQSQNTMPKISQNSNQQSGQIPDVGTNLKFLAEIVESEIVKGCTGSTMDEALPLEHTEGGNAQTTESATDSVVPKLSNPVSEQTLKGDMEDSFEPQPCQCAPINTQNNNVKTFRQSLIDSIEHGIKQSMEQIDVSAELLTDKIVNEKNKSESENVIDSQDRDNWEDIQSDTTEILVSPYDLQEDQEIFVKHQEVSLPESAIPKSQEEQDSECVTKTEFNEFLTQTSHMKECNVETINTETDFLNTEENSDVKEIEKTFHEDEENVYEKGDILIKESTELDHKGRKSDSSSQMDVLDDHIPITYTTSENKDNSGKIEQLRNDMCEIINKLKELNGESVMKDASVDVGKESATNENSVNVDEINQDRMSVSPINADIKADLIDKINNESVTGSSSKSNESNREYIIQDVPEIAETKALKKLADVANINKNNIEDAVSDAEIEHSTSLTEGCESQTSNVKNNDKEDEILDNTYGHEELEKEEEKSPSQMVVRNFTVVEGKSEVIEENSETVESEKSEILQITRNKIDKKMLDNKSSEIMDDKSEVVLDSRLEKVEKEPETLEKNSNLPENESEVVESISENTERKSELINKTSDSNTEMEDPNINDLENEPAPTENKDETVTQENEMEMKANDKNETVSSVINDLVTDCDNERTTEKVMNHSVADYGHEEPNTKEDNLDHGHEELDTEIDSSDHSHDKLDMEVDNSHCGLEELDTEVDKLNHGCEEPDIEVDRLSCDHEEYDTEVGKSNHGCEEHDTEIENSDHDHEKLYSELNISDHMDTEKIIDGSSSNCGDMNTEKIVNNSSMDKIEDESAPEKSEQCSKEIIKEGELLENKNFGKTEIESEHNKQTLNTEDETDDITHFETGEKAKSEKSTERDNSFTKNKTNIQEKPSENDFDDATCLKPSTDNDTTPDQLKSEVETSKSEISQLETEDKTAEITQDEKTTENFVKTEEGNRKLDKFRQRQKSKKTILPDNFGFDCDDDENSNSSLKSNELMAVETGFSTVQHLQPVKEQHTKAPNISPSSAQEGKSKRLQGSAILQASKKKYKVNIEKAAQAAEKIRLGLTTSIKSAEEKPEPTKFIAVMNKPMSKPLHWTDPDFDKRSESSSSSGSSVKDVPTSFQRQQTKDKLSDLSENCCLICGKEFRSVYSLKEHVKNKCRKSYDFSSRFTCSKCGMTSSSQMDMQEHTKKKHSSNILTEKEFELLVLSVYKCELCGETFRDRMSIYSHITTTCVEIHDKKQTFVKNSSNMQGKTRSKSPAVGQTKVKGGVARNINQTIPSAKKESLQGKSSVSLKNKQKQHVLNENPMKLVGMGKEKLEKSDNKVKQNVKMSKKVTEHLDKPSSFEKQDSANAKVKRNESDSNNLTGSVKRLTRSKVINSTDTNERPSAKIKNLAKSTDNVSVENTVNSAGEIVKTSSIETETNIDDACRKLDFDLSTKQKSCDDSTDKNSIDKKSRISAGKKTNEVKNLEGDLALRKSSGSAKHRRTCDRILLDENQKGSSSFNLRDGNDSQSSRSRRSLERASLQEARTTRRNNSPRNDVHIASKRNAMLKTSQDSSAELTKSSENLRDRKTSETKEDKETGRQTRSTLSIENVDITLLEKVDLSIRKIRPRNCSGSTDVSLKSDELETDVPHTVAKRLRKEKSDGDLFSRDSEHSQSLSVETNTSCETDGKGKKKELKSPVLETPPVGKRFIKVKQYDQFEVPDFLKSQVNNSNIKRQFKSQRISGKIMGRSTASPVKLEVKKVANALTPECRKCSKCGQTFTHQSKLIKHIASVHLSPYKSEYNHHTKKVAYRCRFCRAAFKTYILFLKHIPVHADQILSQLACKHASPAVSKLSEAKLARQKMISMKTSEDEVKSTEETEKEEKKDLSDSELKCSEHSEKQLKADSEIKNEADQENHSSKVSTRSMGQGEDVKIKDTKLTSPGEDTEGNAVLSETESGRSTRHMIRLSRSECEQTVEIKKSHSDEQDNKVSPKSKKHSKSGSKMEASLTENEEVDQSSVRSTRHSGNVQKTELKKDMDSENTGEVNDKVSTRSTRSAQKSESLKSVDKEKSEELLTRTTRNARRSTSKQATELQIANEGIDKSPISRLSSNIQKSESKDKGLNDKISTRSSRHSSNNQKSESLSGEKKSPKEVTDKASSRATRQSGSVLRSESEQECENENASKRSKKPSPTATKTKPRDEEKQDVVCSSPVTVRATRNSVHKEKSEVVEEKTIMSARHLPREEVQKQKSRSTKSSQVETDVGKKECLLEKPDDSSINKDSSKEKLNSEISDKEVAEPESVEIEHEQKEKTSKMSEKNIVEPSSSNNTQLCTKSTVKRKSFSTKHPPLKKSKTDVLGTMEDSGLAEPDDEVTFPKRSVRKRKIQDDFVDPESSESEKEVDVPEDDEEYKPDGDLEDSDKDSIIESDADEEIKKGGCKRGGKRSPRLPPAKFKKTVVDDGEFTYIKSPSNEKPSKDSILPTTNQNQSDTDLKKDTREKRMDINTRNDKSAFINSFMSYIEQKNETISKDINKSQNKQLKKLKKTCKNDQSNMLKKNEVETVTSSEGTSISVSKPIPGTSSTSKKTGGHSFLDSFLEHCNKNDSSKKSFVQEHDSKSKMGLNINKDPPSEKKEVTKSAKDPLVLRERDGKEKKKITNSRPSEPMDCDDKRKADIATFKKNHSVISHCNDEEKEENSKVTKDHVTNKNCADIGGEEVTVNTEDPIANKDCEATGSGEVIKETKDSDVVMTDNDVTESEEVPKMTEPAAVSGLVKNDAADKSEHRQQPCDDYQSKEEVTEERVNKATDIHPTFTVENKSSSTSCGDNSKNVDDKLPHKTHSIRTTYHKDTTKSITSTAFQETFESFLSAATLLPHVGEDTHRDEQGKRLVSEDDVVRDIDRRQRGSSVASEDSIQTVSSRCTDISDNGDINPQHEKSKINKKTKSVRHIYHNGKIWHVGKGNVTSMSVKPDKEAVTPPTGVVTSKGITSINTQHIKVDIEKNTTGTEAESSGGNSTYSLTTVEELKRKKKTTKFQMDFKNKKK